METEVEESKVQMRMVLPVLLYHRLITLVITDVMPLLKLTFSGEQPPEPRQMYILLRKGTEPVQPHGCPIDVHGCATVQEMSSSFTGPTNFVHVPLTHGDVLKDYAYSSYACPLTLYFPSNEPQIVEYDSSRQHPDKPHIITQGIINYGDKHYYHLTFYCGDSITSDQS